MILYAAVCTYIHWGKSVKMGGPVSELYVRTRKFRYRGNKAKASYLDVGGIIVSTCILGCDQGTSLMTTLSRCLHTNTIQDVLIFLPARNQLFEITQTIL